MSIMFTLSMLNVISYCYRIKLLAGILCYHQYTAVPVNFCSLRDSLESSLREPSTFSMMSLCLKKYLEYVAVSSKVP